MTDLEKSFIVKPLSVVVVPGTSVTINLPTLLNVEVGATYTLLMDSLPKPFVGTEEVIVNIDKEYAGIDNVGRYVTAQMLHNPDKFCPTLQCNVFRIQIIATGTEKAIAFRRGLACRKTSIEVVTPPTP